MSALSLVVQFNMIYLLFRITYDAQNIISLFLSGHYILKMLIQKHYDKQN